MLEKVTTILVLTFQFVIPYISVNTFTGQDGKRKLPFICSWMDYGIAAEKKYYCILFLHIGKAFDNITHTEIQDTLIRKGV